MDILFMLSLLLALSLLSLGVFAFIYSLIWIFNDAEDRGYPGLIVVILATLLFWPFSLLIWLVLRPRLTYV
jgi:hypothetical protein